MLKPFGKFFIGLFISFSSFILIIVVMRFILGLEPLYLSDFINYFDGIDVNNWSFFDSIKSFANSVSNFKSINWDIIDNPGIIDYIVEIFELIIEFFKYIVNIIGSTFKLIYSVIFDLILTLKVFWEMVSFLFT